jgi:hypothetical protein
VTARILRSLVVAAFAAAAATAGAQPNPRRATSIAALRGFPGFYHGRPIVLAATVGLEKDELRASDEGESIRLIFKGNAPDGLDEIRGEFWDIGRMKSDDIRLNGYDLKKTFKMDPDAPWPRPGEVTAIIASAVSSTTLPAAPSIRAISLYPNRYLDQKVTITGQFTGRNLMGGLPEAPGKSRYDFVLRAADSSIWVINMRPKIRDAVTNKEVEFALDSRLDTSRWLEISGTVQQGRGLLWIDATAGSLKVVKPPQETTTEAEEPVHVPAGPPPEVIFSTPTDDEADVQTNAFVRVQFSRDIDQASLKGHVRAQYMESQALDKGAPPPPVDVTTRYNAASRVLEIRFTKPLERFRTLKVDLVEGILGTDQQPLKPWTLTFSLGGS